MALFYDVVLAKTPKLSLEVNQSVGYVCYGIYFDLLFRPPLAPLLLILLLILDVEKYPIITSVIISWLRRPLDHDLRRAIAPLQGG
jgi:hypothetical protein